MTREEAIKILDQKTCRDALMEFMGGSWNQTQALALIGEAQKMGLDALRAQENAPPNASLTLGELWKMEGEPVYIANVGYGYYALVREVLDHSVWVVDKTGNCILLPISTFGKDWLAYRHKPNRD